MTLPYGALVLEHFRRPRNQRALEHPSASHEGFNPLCGDRVRIELDVVDAVIRAAAFTANACAICTASASLLTERVTGLPLERAARISDAEALAALESEVPKARVACAVLPLATLREAIRIATEASQA
jgi:nitrogen fixation NifU-like protein